MNIRKSYYTQPFVKVLCGAVLISFSAVFVKIADVAPISSAYYRVFIGSIFLLIIYLSQRSPFPNFLSLLPMTCFCGFLFAIDLLFWHTSISYIGPGLATILSNFQVFILAGFGVIFFKEKLNLKYLLSIPLAIAGLVLIVGIDQGLLNVQYKMGILFGILTAICYASFILCLRRIQCKEDNSEVLILLLLSVFAAIFLALKMIYSSESFLIPDLKSGLALLGLGLLCQTIGWLLISHSLPRIRASLVGLILLIQPSLSFFWDVTIFHRPTELLNWVGVTLTLSAIYLGIIGNKQSS